MQKGKKGETFLLFLPFGRFIPLMSWRVSLKSLQEWHRNEER